MTTPLNNIKIILCNTSHPGNIGAVARAMKTMGITQLTLVNPTASIDDHALALASNAADILHHTTIVDNLPQALADSTIAIALTARKREFNYHIQTPKEIVKEILTNIAHNAKVAIVFGSEKNGLSYNELELCNRLVTIPANPAYNSLNLAQAVQIICYEIYSNYSPELLQFKSPIKTATTADIQGVINHLDQILQQTVFYKNKNTTVTKRRLQNIINKANLEHQEVDLLRGMLKQLENLFTIK